MMMWLSEKGLAGLLNTNNRRLLQPGAMGQPQTRLDLLGHQGGVSFDPSRPGRVPEFYPFE